MQGQQRCRGGKCCNLCMYEIKWGLKKPPSLGEGGNKSKVMKHGKEERGYLIPREKEEKAEQGL